MHSVSAVQFMWTQTRFSPLEIGNVLFVKTLMNQWFNKLFFPFSESALSMCSELMPIILINILKTCRLHAEILTGNERKSNKKKRYSIVFKSFGLLSTLFIKYIIFMWYVNSGWERSHLIDFSLLHKTALILFCCVFSLLNAIILL